MKWTIGIIMVIFLACNQSANTGEEPAGEEQVAEAIDPMAVAVTDAEIDAKLNAGHFIFRSDAPAGGWPDGMPATLRAAKGKQWKYQKKRDWGLEYFEVCYIDNMLLLKPEPMRFEWDTFLYELKGDTIYPYKIAKTGQREETPDFMVIDRVNNNVLDISDYNRKNPEKRYQLDFKLENPNPPVFDLEAIKAKREDKAKRTQNSMEQLNQK